MKCPNFVINQNGEINCWLSFIFIGRQKLWVHFCEQVREDISFMTEKDRSTKTLCNRHFSSETFLKFNSKLVWNAVPSVHYPRGEYNEKCELTECNCFYYSN